VAGFGFTVELGGDEVVGFAEDFSEAEWEFVGSGCKGSRGGGGPASAGDKGGSEGVNGNGVS